MRVASGRPLEPAPIVLVVRHGFAGAGVESQVAWKHGRWLDVTVMQLPLSPSKRQIPSTASRRTTA